MKTRSGTKEWSDFSRNIDFGCKNGCRYCYAASNAMRFQRIRDYKQWLDPHSNKNGELEKPKLLNGRIMFPTTHDITQDNMARSILFLKAWLAKGNDFLIVSKPDPKCITALMDHLEEYRSSITFRFTIGSNVPENLEFWEPHAPSFEDRLQALQSAYLRGWKTSVSMEPYYDDSVIEVAKLLLPYVNDSLWIGMMNHIDKRVKWELIDHPRKDICREEVLRVSNKDFVDHIYNTFRYNERVKWKESIKKILGLPMGDKAE